MDTPGQMVEIPANSPLFKRDLPLFSNSEAELRYQAAFPQYTLFDGFLVGEHSGLSQFRVGQRRGISVGGKKKPLYVIQLQPAEHRLFVGAGLDHPGLYKVVFSFEKEDFTWEENGDFTRLSGDGSLEVEIQSPVSDRIRKAELFKFGDTFFLKFDNPVRITFSETPFELYYHSKLIATIFKK